MSVSFVLVSGAWHGGWCWERVAPLLEAEGYRVAAPDPLGMGSDKTPLASVNLAAWGDQIAAVVGAQPEPVVLVGHSRGGVIISEAAERVPDKIASLVYLAAFLLPDGATLGGASGRGRSEEAPRILIKGEDGTTTVEPSAVASNFYNTTSPEWVARAQSLLTPEPMASFATPLKLTDDRFGRVPRAYVEALQDRAVRIELQRSMHAALPCDPVITLDTDHSPFYSDPEALAAALLQVARMRGG